MLALNIFSIFSLFALPVPRRGWFGLRDNSHGAGGRRPGSSNAPQDHLGSIRLLTDEAGGVTERTTWGPWGARLEGGRESRFGYTGHQTERESGLRYSVHRYLDPRNGRWTRRDPAGDVDGANLYRYVMNRPVIARDRTGLYTTIFPEEIHSVIVPPLMPTMGFSIFQRICMTGRDGKEAVDRAMQLAYSRFLMSFSAQRFFTEIEPDFLIDSRFAPGTLPVITHIDDPLQVGAVNAYMLPNSGLIKVAPWVLKSADEEGAAGIEFLAKTLVHELGHWVRVVLNGEETREKAGFHSDPRGRGEGWEAVEAVFGSP